MPMSLEKVVIMSRSSLAFVRDLAKSLRSSTKNIWLSDFESVILCMYVCMYVCTCTYIIYVSGQIAQVVEHQTADPWIVGSSLTSGEQCKNC